MIQPVFIRIWYARRYYHSGIQLIYVSSYATHNLDKYAFQACNYKLIYKIVGGEDPDVAKEPNAKVSFFVNVQQESVY